MNPPGNNGNIPLPVIQPGQPFQNITNANKYLRGIQGSNLSKGQPGAATDADVAQALVYEASLVRPMLPPDNQAPVWVANLQASVNALAALPATVNALQGSVNNLVGLPANVNAIQAAVNNLANLPADINAIQASLLALKIITYKSANRTRLDGHDHHYEIVPRADGVLPTDPPHNLAPITTISVIRAMGGNELNAYLAFYNIHNPAATLAIRRACLSLAIGILFRFDI